ncbi:MAG: glycosyltransferase, partial [Candidatus Binatia bacterium]
RRALAVVVPSIVPEALNRTVLEAMAVGTPVLATDSGGIHDQIEHDRSGLVLAPDAGAFASALRSLANDPARRERYVREAAARVRASFDVAAVRPRIESLYGEVMSARGRGE